MMPGLLARRRAGQTIYLHETFSEADGTEINGKAAAPVAGASNWATRRGNGPAGNSIYQTNGGRLRNVSTQAFPDHIAYIQSASADGILTGDILFNTTYFPGLIFRDNATDWLMLFMNAAQTFGIYRYNGGSYTSLGTSAARGSDYVTGNYYSFEITLNGSSIVAKDLATGTTLSITSTVNQTQKGVGFRAYTQAALSMADNLKMVPL